MGNANCTFNETTGELIINTEGGNVIGGNYNTPWDNIRNKITKVEIKGHITFEEGSYLNSLFAFCYNCESFDGLENLDVSNVINIAGIFSMDTNYPNENLKELNVSDWNTAKVIYMSYMFENCIKLKLLNVYNWNVTNVTSMHYMFYNCSNLDKIDLTNWNVANVNTIYSIFYGCSSLKSIKFPNVMAIDDYIGLTQLN